MKIEISVAEVVQVFKEIQEQPEMVLEMVKADMPQVVGGYLSEMMRLVLLLTMGYHLRRISQIRLQGTKKNRAILIRWMKIISKARGMILMK